MKKIALERHFVPRDLVGYGSSTRSIAEPLAWSDAARRRLDVTEERPPEVAAGSLDVEAILRGTEPATV